MAKEQRSRAGFSIFLPVVAAITAYFVAYPRVFWPRIENWGASNEEVDTYLPGDELVPNPRYKTTRAITIDVPASNVWPWIVQVGHKRAGLYSDRKSAYRIMPEFQELSIGDKIELLPQFDVAVSNLEPGKTLTLLKRADMNTGEDFGPTDPLPERYYIWTLTWFIMPIGSDRTRLILRNRIAHNANMMSNPLLRALFEPSLFITERNHLLGLKERTESQYRGGRLQAV